tara:strand:+ start:24 stop:425 length:402 start_codon:yes stop_codon:yes gene_type:complete
MKSGIVSLLANESTISDIVSTRIYISKAPQTADLPHIVVTQIGSNENQTLDGTTGLRFVNFDIDCKDDRSVGAETLGDAVRVFMDDASGTAGSQTIDAVLLNDESTDYEPPVDGSDKGVHVVLLDVTIQYVPA